MIKKIPPGTLLWASGDEGLESPGLCASVASHDSTIAQSKVRPSVTRPHKHKQERAPQSEREAATRGEREQAAAPDGNPSGRVISHHMAERVRACRKILEIFWVALANESRPPVKVGLNSGGVLPPSESKSLSGP